MINYWREIFHVRRNFITLIIIIRRKQVMKRNESKIDPHFRMHRIAKDNSEFIVHFPNKSIKIIIKLFEFIHIYLSSIQLFTYAKLSRIFDERFHCF